MNKNFLRYSAVAVILGTVAFLLFWYWSMKREVPQHARVIPSDAMAVVTLNLKELASDQANDGHLFPEMADQAIFEKELEQFTRAIENNDGETGIEQSADVLLFTYRSTDEAFIGVAVQLEDSATFGQLMRTQFTKEFQLRQLSMGGNPVMQYDTTAAVFGWTNDVALLLYPLGDHSIATVSSQCTALLKQQEQNSVLANENFRKMELNSFAMSMWIQTKPLLETTEGGSLIKAIAEDVETYSYFAEFEDGEILIRSEWLLADENKRKMIKEFPFPCDTSLIRSFVRGRFELDKDSQPKSSFAEPGLFLIPLSDEECTAIYSGMSGDYIYVDHDDYDSLYRLETHSFYLTDPDRVKSIITAAMQRDSIPLTNNGWNYEANFGHWRMIVDENLLTITNHPAVDGRAHGITPDLAGYMAWFNLQKNFAHMNGVIAWVAPAAKPAAELISQHLTTCSVTVPVQFGNVRHSEIAIHFRNTNVNSLIQLEELARKIYSGK